MSLFPWISKVEVEVSALVPWYRLAIVKNVFNDVGAWQMLVATAARERKFNMSPKNSFSTASYTREN